MKTLKLLFTGIGRRVELIQAFRQAANHLNIHLKIYGADMLETAPALIYCDAVQKAWIRSFIILIIIDGLWSF